MVTRKFVLATLITAVAFVVAACGSSPTRESLGEQIDDSVITSKVKALFIEDKTVSALNINVETFKGTVQLSGFATKLQEIDRAVEIARGVKGVALVRNDIILRKTAS